MESPLSVNDLLKDTITKIDYKLVPPGYVGDVPTARRIQQQLSNLIDGLGQESAQAQELGRVITTSDKLRSSPSHILYLLKDQNANGGAGRLIGLLKIGKKDLYLFHPNGELLKSSPMCVLDFYISSDYQRRGLGKQLFDYMLSDINLQAFQFAIDYPSKKMEQFLKRNYDLKCLLRQSNNFAVSSEFFGVQNSNDTETFSPSHAVGRFAAPKPTSEIGNIIHGTTCGDQSNPPSRAVTPTRQKNVSQALPTVGTIHFPIPGSCIDDMVSKPISAEEVLVRIDPVQVQSPERPSTLQVESTPTRTPVRSVSPAGISTPRRDSQITDRGNIDIKFHHSKLW